jgi:hypothetical protein
VFTQEPSRKIDGNKLGFAMPRRYIDADSVFFTIGNVHKLVCQDAVMLANLVIRLHVLAKLDQVHVTRSSVVSFSYRIGNLRDLMLFLRVELIYMSY